MTSPSLAQRRSTRPCRDDLCTAARPAGRGTAGAALGSNTVVRFFEIPGLTPFHTAVKP
jgi:hypothetical protein